MALSEVLPHEVLNRAPANPDKNSRSTSEGKYRITEPLFFARNRNPLRAFVVRDTMGDEPERRLLYSPQPNVETISDIEGNSQNARVIRKNGVWVEVSLRNGKGEELVTSQYDLETGERIASLITPEALVDQPEIPMQIDQEDLTFVKDVCLTLRDATTLPNEVIHLAQLFDKVLPLHQQAQQQPLL